MSENNYLLPVVILPAAGWLLARIAGALKGDRGERAGQQYEILQTLGTLASLFVWIFVVLDLVFRNLDSDGPVVLIQSMWEFFSSGTKVSLGLAVDPAGSVFMSVCLAAAAAVMILNRSSGRASIENAGLLTSGILLLACSQGPLTALAAWGLIAFAGMMQENGRNSDSGNFSTLYLIPAGGVALYAVLGMMTYSGMSWIDLSQATGNTLTADFAGMSLNQIAAAAAVITLLPAAGVWPFTPWWARCGTGGSHLWSSIGPGAAAVFLSARILDAVQMPAWFYLIVLVIGALSAVTAIAYALKTARGSYDVSLRYMAASTHGMAVVALALGSPWVAIAVESAFVLSRAFVIMPENDYAFTQTGGRTGAIAFLAGAVGLCFVPLSPGFGALSALVRFSSRPVEGINPVSQPIALAAAFIFIVGAVAWSMEFFRMLRHRQGDIKGASNSVAAAAIIITAVLTLAAGFLSLPGLGLIEPALRTWMNEIPEPAFNAQLAGMTLVLMAGGILSAYSMLKKGFSPGSELGGSIISPLFRLSDALAGQGFKTSFQSSVARGLGMLADRVIIVFAERMISDRLIAGTIERILAFPVKLVKGSSENSGEEDGGNS